MRCSCGKEAVLPLFEGTNRMWGLCEEHTHRFDVHPLIYVDGVGSDGINFYKKNVVNIRYRRPYADVVISYPTAVDGEGTYTDRAKDTIQQTVDYMKALDVSALSPTKPILFIGSPFAVFANCLLMEPDRAEQLAVHFLLRPAVWVVASHNNTVPQNLREVVYLAHKTQPFTFTRFVTIGKSNQSYWLPLKIAHDLWVGFSTSRKRMNKQKTGVIADGTHEGNQDNRNV